MGRLTTGACLLLLAAAPGASAAPLGELPFTPLPERDAAWCLDATGAPGGLTLLGPNSRTQSATDLLTAGGDGATRAARVQIGRLLQCPSVAEAAGGAAVVAGRVARPVGGAHRPELRAVVRDPGGAFGPATRLGTSLAGERPLTAVSPSGYAVVVWRADDPQGVRIMAARRVPGGAFGPAETVARGQLGALQAASDASGTVTLAWLRRGAFGSPSDLESATATPGAPFAVERVASGDGGGGSLPLATAPDGWTLLGYAGEVFERAPGAAGFTPVSLSPPPGRSAAVAVRSGGGAVVAWMEDREGAGSVMAATRAAGGPFTAPASVAGVGFGPNTLDAFMPYDVYDPLGGPPLAQETKLLDASLAADGRVLLAWLDPRGRNPHRLYSAHVATGRLEGAFDRAQVLGGALRNATAVAPVFLADGRTAVAWTDNAALPFDGRLHLAVEGAAEPPAPPVPRLSVRHPGRVRLYGDQPLRLRVGCDRACDVRARIGLWSFKRSHPASLLQGGSRRVAAGTAGIKRARGSRTVLVIVRASAPGARAVVERTLRVRVTRRPDLPIRRALDLRARRRGDAILVTWRTAGPARRHTYSVLAFARRRQVVDELGSRRHVLGRGRARFAVRLWPDRPERTRFVGVVPNAQGRYSVSVPVR